MIHFRKAFFDTLLFSLPIIAGQIGHMLFGVGDTIIVGRLSTVALSALGIATAIITPLKIVGLGTTYVISPMKANGVSSRSDVRHFYCTSLVLGSIVGVITALLQLAISYVPYDFGLPSDVITLVRGYLRITAFAMIPAILFQVCKENLQAEEKVLIPNVIILLFNGVNILLNLYFVLSRGWGLTGAAIATVLSQLGMCALLYFYAVKTISTELLFSRELLLTFFRKGIPVGLGAVITALVFSVVTILSGGMGIQISAANNLVIIISSVTFMVPYAVSSAVSVKVGQKKGEGCYRGVSRYGGASIAIGLISAPSMGLLFLTVPRQILGLMSSDEAALSYGVSLLLVVAFYQIPDSLMCISMGALRGMGRTFSQMIWNFVGIWGIGFPAGIYLAYGKGMKAVGLWWGLTIGLSVTAVVFIVLFIRSVLDMKREIVKVPN